MEFGARPLKRIVQAQVETLLARKIIANEVKEGDKIEVFYDKRIPGLNIRPKIENPENQNQLNSANKSNQLPAGSNEAGKDDKNQDTNNSENNE